MLQISVYSLSLQLLHSFRYPLNISHKISGFFLADSPFRTPISSAILQLQEGGKLHILKEKWWKQKKGGGKCKVINFSRNLVSL